MNTKWPYHNDRNKSKDWSHPAGFIITLPEDWIVNIVGDTLKAVDPEEILNITFSSLANDKVAEKVFQEESLLNEFPNHQYGSPIKWEEENGIIGKLVYGKNNISDASIDKVVTLISKHGKYVLIRLYIPRIVADRYEDNIVDIFSSAKL